MCQTEEQRNVWSKVGSNLARKQLTAKLFSRFWTSLSTSQSCPFILFHFPATDDCWRILTQDDCEPPHWIRMNGEFNWLINKMQEKIIFTDRRSWTRALTSYALPTMVENSWLWKFFLGDKYNYQIALRTDDVTNLGTLLWLRQTNCSTFQF